MQVGLDAIFHRQHGIDARQLQIQPFHFPGDGSRHRRATQLAPQPGHDPQQGLALRRALRRLHRRLGQFEGQRVFANALQHTNHPQPRAGISAVAINTQRQGKIADALAMLAHLEQQFASASLQPRIVQDQRADVIGDRFERFAGFEALLAFMQEQAGIDVLAAAQPPGFSAELDGFIGKDAQVRQHELRPILVEVAKKHQSQTIAQVHDRDTEQPFFKLWAPVAKWLGFAEAIGQGQQPLGLSCLGLLDQVPQAQEDFRLEQHIEQLDQAQIGVLLDPTQRQQRRYGGADLADLRVVKLAVAKMQALTHHQPHQQALGRTRQGRESIDELLFFNAEHITVTLAQPGEYALEVVQVIEGIVEGVGCHGSGATKAGYWLCVQISVTETPGNCKR